MDEQIFYIDNCLPGIWENDDYSFSFQLGTPKLLMLTDKQGSPNTGSGLTYMVVKGEPYPILRVIATTESKTWAVDYLISHIDCAANILKLLLEGAEITLYKTGSYSK